MQVRAQSIYYRFRDNNNISSSTTIIDVDATFEYKMTSFLDKILDKAEEGIKHTEDQIIGELSRSP